MRPRIAYVPLFLLASAACERVESSDVRTSGIYADMTVTARGDGESQVSAALRVGGSLSNTYLELVDGDELMAIQGEDEVRMSKRSIPLGPVSYVASFPVDAENTPFRVSFSREPHDEAEKACRGGSAPSSFATLPAPFTIDGPDAGRTFSRADDDIEVTWSPTGSRDRMSWRVSGSCVENDSGDIDSDSGRFVVRRGDLRPIENRERDDCSLTIEIVRQRAGQIDPAYGEGGRFVARQVRQIRVESVP